MSDYYGDATLEDWLKEELFYLSSDATIPSHIVARFEKWREGIERSIEAWMESDDGDGNPLSWRSWGRGFYGIPAEDADEFEKIARESLEEINNIL